jgi:fucose 4-O-acetylase-like acetyltransferase
MPNSYPAPSTRLSWLDAAKGFGLLLVVLGHSNSWNVRYPDEHRFIYSFHMPLFFFLTGCTLNLTSPKATLRRVLSLAVPYFIISIVMLPISMSSSKGTPIEDLLLGVLYGTGHTIGTVPLWFITCTAAGLILIAALQMVNRHTIDATKGAQPKHVASIGFILLATGFTFLSSINFHPKVVYGWGNLAQSGLPWNMDLALVAAGYMLTGKAFMALLSERQSRLSSTKNLLIAITSLGALATLSYAIPIDFDLNHRRATPTLLSGLTPFLGISASLAIGFLAQRAPLILSVLTSIGQSGLIILWLHAGLENRGSKLLFSKWLDQDNLLFWTAAFVFSVLTPVLIDKFIIRKSRYLQQAFYPKFKSLIK